jgi:hypothetical protein
MLSVTRTQCVRDVKLRTRSPFRVPCATSPGPSRVSISKSAFTLEPWLIVLDEANPKLYYARATAHSEHEGCSRPSRITISLKIHLGRLPGSLPDQLQDSPIRGALRCSRICHGLLVGLLLCCAIVSRDISYGISLDGPDRQLRFTLRFVPDPRRSTKSSVISS